jgi:hypothetical protein
MATHGDDVCRRQKNGQEALRTFTKSWATHYLEVDARIVRQNFREK